MDLIRKRWHAAAAALISILLVVSLDLLTNSLDTHKFSWDFRYYVGMAQNGLKPPLAGPFAYRYLTPALVHGLTHFLGVGLETGFRTVAYLGAFAQVLGVFLFARWITRSTRGAFVALAATAFSLYNVKFLLFDVYRPDHLAYGLILLQTYLALKRKFLPLLVCTLVASQVREFNLIPLIAYLIAAWREQHDAAAPPARRRSFVVEVVASSLGLIAAVGLPRLLIPVAENFQFAGLSRDGILRILIAPLVLPRDLNFIYSLVAYALPFLMLMGFKDFSSIWQSLEGSARTFLTVYVSLVVVFSFLGGTDFQRFSSYLFMPQAIFVGYLVLRRRLWQIAIMLVAVFIFNRIWLPFPMADTGTYLDFYGGWAERFNSASVARLVECLSFICVGFMARRFPSVSVAPVPTPRS